MFELFTNKIYITTQITQWILAFLNIYILWREYRFTRNIKEVPVAIRQYMPTQRYAFIKQKNESELFFEMVSSSLILLIHIAWSDELSHISLWNYSKWLSGSTRESMVTLVFIAVITCIDFLFALPKWLYTVIKFSHETWVNIFQAMFLHFCLEIVSQCLVFSVLVYMSNSQPNMSKKMMVYSVAATILGIFIVQQLSFRSVYSNFLVPLEEPAINRELEPFLKKIGFPEGRIFLLKMHNPEDLPNAFTIGSWFLNNEMIVVTDNLIGES